MNALRLRRLFASSLPLLCLSCVPLVTACSGSPDDGSPQSETGVEGPTEYGSDAAAPTTPPGASDAAVETPQDGATVTPPQADASDIPDAGEADNYVDPPPPERPDAGEADAGLPPPPPPPPPPPVCVGTQLPTEDPCVIDEPYGIFVSSSKGTADGAGTRAQPVRSLQRAVALAKTSGKRVYACAESYEEALTLENGVSIFGMFDCNRSNWPLAPRRAVVRSPSSPAVRATNITSDTRVEGVEFIAPNFGNLPPAQDAQSSIGLLAVNAPKLRIVEGRIRAGSGQDGASGADAPQYVNGRGFNGTNSVKVSACRELVVVGQPTWLCARTVQGAVNECVDTAGVPAPPEFRGGRGGDGAAAATFRYTQRRCEFLEICSPSRPYRLTLQDPPGEPGAPSGGADGADGTNGANGTAFGTVTATGYVPSHGSAGTHGRPGAGGWGGAVGAAPPFDSATAVRETWQGESGASGGAGGCAGRAGTAGRGGGASLAIVAFESPMTLERVDLETANGGRGGVGSVGASGTAPGWGGTGGSPERQAQSGERGGRGGNSGSGGGGPSVGIVYRGTKPVREGGAFTGGEGGRGAPQRERDQGLLPASPNGAAELERAIR